MVVIDTRYFNIIMKQSKIKKTKMKKMRFIAYIHINCFSHLSHKAEFYEVNVNIPITFVFIL